MQITFSIAKQYILRFGKYGGQNLTEASKTDEGLLYLDWLVGEEWIR